MVAARFVFDIAGYSMYSQEKAAKIKLLSRMATPEGKEELENFKPKADLDEINRQARELGIYGD
jgi:hypothetical protein